MTETTFATPRLVRPRDAALKGVCAALARATGTDVVLWQVLFVVLTFFGGLGIALYLVGVVAIPQEGEERSLADRLLHGPDRHLTAGQGVLLVAVAVVSLIVAGSGEMIIPALVIGVLALLLHRNRKTHQPPPTPGATTAPLTYETAAAPTYVAPPPFEAPPPRPRSVLGSLTTSCTLLVVGVLLVLSALGADGITIERVFAAALAVVGAGLVAGAWWGRSRGLIALAVVLALGLGATLAARPAIDFGVGERRWVPTAAAGGLEYRLGIGDATLDLRQLPAREGQQLRIDATVDVGHLLVLIPENLRVSLDAETNIGELVIDDVMADGTDVSRHVDLGPEGRPQVVLDLNVNTGQVEVRRG